MNHSTMIAPTWRILLVNGEIVEFTAPFSDLQLDAKSSIPEGNLCFRWRGCWSADEWICFRMTHWEGGMVVTPVPNVPGTVAGDWEWDGLKECVAVEDPVLAALLGSEREKE